MRRAPREQFILLAALTIATIALVFAYQSDARAKKLQSAFGEFRVSFEHRLSELDLSFDRQEREILSLRNDGYVSSDDFTVFAERVKRATVIVIVNSEAVGSGFFIDPNGIIATAFHVAEAAGDLFDIQTIEGKIYSARVVAKDVTSDIALLRIQGESFSALPLGYFENIATGEEVGIAGLNGGFSEVLIHRGTISSKDADAGQKRFSVNAFINKGNSGGPIFSALTGRVIGMVSARQTDVQSDKLIQLPSDYAPAFAIGGLDPIKFNVDLYNETVKLVGDVSQVGIGFGIASDHIRSLLHEIK